ncbi:Hint domain-containing protein [Streptomyces sp. NPDC047000]|uniref:Hint domain-containing protein n=1 Tax=Streptomyces sp. NPDC047000 TaxID=3155474 RepID=UPI0033C46B96
MHLPSTRSGKAVDFKARKTTRQDPVKAADAGSVQRHPVIAAVVATAVVVGVIACVALTAGGCGAVLMAGATGFTAGAETGSIGVAAVGASIGVIGEGGAVIAGAMGIAGTGAAAVAEGAETATASKAATESGAKAADEVAEGTARSGAARGSERAETAAPKSGSCDHSFLPATKVLMADGHEKKIKDIEPGDKVRATDPKTGKTQSRPVKKLITTRHDKDFATLTVRSGGKSSKITATVTHPFWITSKATWTKAGNIQPGMRLLSASGAAVVVSAVEIWHRQHLTHDLTVGFTHTYYVLAGKTPVLVHNCGGDLLRRARELYGTRADEASTVAVARVRNVNNPDKVETWVATDTAAVVLDHGWS